MREEKRPKNIPASPPHVRIGRAIYIYAAELAGWVQGIKSLVQISAAGGKKRRGRPTLAERLARREANRI